MPLWFLYKHHLFGNSIEGWIKDEIEHAEVYQPDTGVDKLFKYMRNPGHDLVVVTGNEIGDIIHEAIVLHLNQGNKNTLYTKNIFLGSEFVGLSEYQTVHGSVDDLVGTGLVNPTAMIRAAAAISEELGFAGVVKMTENILSTLIAQKMVTPDQGGLATTDSMIRLFLKKVNTETIGEEG